MTRIRAAGAAAILILSMSSCAKPEEVKPADAKAYMIEHVQPAAQNYWDAVQYISDEKGAREIVPTNAEEWNRTVEAARVLKQSAEILKQPAYAANRGTDWQDFAEGLAQAAARAETAAQSHEPDTVLEAGGTLYNVCTACHEIYLPTPVRLGPDPHNSTQQ
ncbi:hypothetical protein [Sphingobium sp. BS19]|uniref:hypothetical protein n=1 Tax=Sphingobium sp. BS19 TaxID=3018973 RepID=UPI0022ED776D|nr:hypothetical protein [Sphingobium sp. BS19]GLI96384.1 hypothetical protein Sbs19_02020 [Sphingobium sp. BS19]